MTRRCARCRRELDESMFYRRPNGKFGSYCADCRGSRKHSAPAPIPEREPAGPIVPGDVVRVDDWPGTFGLRFLVQKIDVERGAVHALELEPKGAAVRFRAFPIENARVDRRAARQRAEFVEALGRRSR